LTLLLHQQVFKKASAHTLQRETPTRFSKGKVKEKGHCQDIFAFGLFPNLNFSPVPEIIDPVFAKTGQNARFLLSENERFELVFVKTGSINSGTELFKVFCY
jgi:hypothetical protein